MHELSIALSLLDVVTEEAERHGGRVAVIHLKLGPLCGVVTEALRSAYDLARVGTAFDQTDLVIEEVPLVVHCPACAAAQTLSAPLLLCPVCGGPTPEVLSGRELEVAALEVLP